jgi:predicted RND superfamily exporter protein
VTSTAELRGIQSNSNSPTTQLEDQPNTQPHEASGWPLIYADLLKAMAPDTRKALAWGFFAMGLLLLIDTRNLRSTLGLLLPAALTLAWTLGALQWLGIRLNPFNLLAFPIALSFATLNSLLLYHRFREEGLDSFPLVLRRLILPLGLSAMAVSASFIPFIPSTSGGLASLGITALISLTAAWLSSLLVAAGAFPGWQRK